MPKGGARTRSGPAPDPNALRRDRPGDTAWVVLPAEGRKGPTPKWPLAKQTPAEKGQWAKLWRMPQAVMWEQLRLHDQVAMYVRNWCEATLPEASSSLRTLHRQLADALGLTAPGMASLRWKVATDEVAPRRVDSSAVSKTASASSMRARLAAVHVASP